MNDEASSSAAAYPPHEDGQRAPEAAPTEAEIAEKRKENRQLFNKKRGALLDDLLRNLDILVYAQLSVIYYMECVPMNVIQDRYVLTSSVAAHSYPSYSVH